MEVLNVIARTFISDAWLKTTHLPSEEATPLYDKMEMKGCEEQWTKAKNTRQQFPLELWSEKASEQMMQPVWTPKHSSALTNVTMRVCMWQARPARSWQLWLGAVNSPLSSVSEGRPTDSSIMCLPQHHVRRRARRRHIQHRDRLLMYPWNCVLITVRVSGKPLAVALISAGVPRRLLLADFQQSLFVYENSSC